MINNQHHISPLALLTKQSDKLLVDVRTPAEFKSGHIPGAINIPLFSNEERVKVGTVYKKESPRKALLLGLELVGPKMSDFIKQLDAVSNENKINCYCWRGGQRSQSMAWLFEKAGYEVNYLKGGYKAYRHFIQTKMRELKLPLIVLGGRTGCGKSMILKQLSANNEQVIDLEAMANHKGSAFGGIAENPQPSTEHFENKLFQKIQTLDQNKRIWVENESRLIGSVHMPLTFWEQMKAAPVVYIDFPKEERLKFLVNTYGNFPTVDLKDAFAKIKKRLGGLAYQQAVESLEQDDITTAALIALRYYDKSYNYLLENNKAPNIYELHFDEMNFQNNATALVEFLDQQKLNIL